MLKVVDKLNIKIIGVGKLKEKYFNCLLYTSDAADDVAGVQISVVAVVTRYFGGIKLGAGGLIRAYSNSTTNAIHKAGLVQLVTQAILEITVSYAQHDSLLHYLKEHQIEVADEQFGATVQTSIYVDEDQVAAFTKLLISRFNDQLTIKKGTSREHEIPYLTNQLNTVSITLRITISSNRIITHVVTTLVL